MLLDGGHEVIDRVVDAQVDDLEAGPFHHHPGQVLADVVDVALDRTDDHGADLFRARLGQQRPQDGHARLHRLGGHEHFGHEKDAVAEVGADDVHAGDEAGGEDGIRLVAAFEHDVDFLDDLLSVAVVEVFLHQFIDLVVRHRLQVDLFVTHDTYSSCSAGCSTCALPPSQL